MACLICRRLKIRCSGGKPCVRCGRLARNCIYDDESRQEPKVDNSSIGPSPKRQRMERVASPEHTITDPQFIIPLTDHVRDRATNQISPPFSTFVYADPSIDRGEGSSSVPRCILPFPQMMDPIQSGIMTEQEAVTLYDKFIIGAGAHVPLVDGKSEDLRGRSSYLFTIALAVARVAATPLLDAETGILLENLASNYLAHSLLMRPGLLEDVVATLYTAIYNITRIVGGGSSSYLTIGHAQRMSRRLRLHEAPPLTDAWAVVVECETFDHMYALGYGRPFSSDSPVRRVTDEQLISCPDPRLLTIVARWELVPVVRDLVAWVKQARTSLSTGLDHFGSLNDRLDDWHFRWFSPASPLSNKITGDLSFTLLLATHVRLSLNMIPIQSTANASVQTKARRLALTAASGIVDAFSQPGTTLATAPALAGSILAHATLSLLPVRLVPAGAASSVPTLGEGSSFAKTYFDKAIEAMTNEAIDRGLLTKVFAETIQELLIGQTPKVEGDVDQIRHEPSNRPEEIPVHDNFMEFMAAFNGHDMNLGGQLWSELLDPFETGEQ